MLTLKIILEALFNRQDSIVIEMINKSIPIKKYHFKDKLFVIHSGFRFTTVDQKSFDILIDLSELDHPKLIHIPILTENSFPLLLGLVIFKKENYLDAFSTAIIVGLSEDKTKLYPIESEIEDIINYNLKHSEFYIFNSVDNSIIKRFPLSRLFTSRLSLIEGKFHP